MAHAIEWPQPSTIIRNLNIAAKYSHFVGSAAAKAKNRNTLLFSLFSGNRGHHRGLD
jgi:hypothetical protein